MPNWISGTQVVRLVGRDNDEMQFVTGSWTDRNTEYSITVDCRIGECRCNCKDAVCRMKRPDFLDLLLGKPGVRCCKHQALLVSTYHKLLKENTK